MYQPVSARVLVVCLNITTLEYAWQGYDLPLLERLVSLTASIVERGVASGYRVGLLSNGHLAHSDQPFRVQPGRAPNQLSRLLEALAAVTPFAAVQFERYLLAEMPRLPYGSSLVLVTAQMPPGLIETILRLKQRGHSLTLLTLASTPPPVLPGVQVFHLSNYDQAGQEKTLEPLAGTAAGYGNQPLGAEGRPYA
jgi:uncharacterized protein (DUF58 family)